MRPDTGLTHLGQGAFEGGPGGQEFVEEALLGWGRDDFLLHKGEYSTVKYAYYSICILLTFEKNTLKLQTPPPRRPRPKPTQLPNPQLLRTAFCPSQLLRTFHKLLPAELLASWLALADKAFYARAFTPLLTLWYLIFQRLGPHRPLSDVVDDALAGGADALSPRSKPLSRQLRSRATASYSDARQRLPLGVCRKTLWHTASGSAAALKVPLAFGLRVGLMDGSTCRMRPYGDIPEHFPPHRSGGSKKLPYWCVARVVGIFCSATGLALDSLMAALKTSEQALSALLLGERSWKGWLLLADRNFGVYSILRATVGAQAQALFRLTQSRAAKLARLAGLKLRPGLDAPLCWPPSRHDQCPAALPPSPVEGRLIAAQVARPGFRSFTLYLFTTLKDPRLARATELVTLYARRWHVELCFRYIKSQMDLGLLECHSAAMARKEWLIGLIAYNLIRWTMAAAAALAPIPVQCLSFSRARQLLLRWLAQNPLRRPSLRSWHRLLSQVAQARLPQRRKPRPPEPRAVRYFNTNFQKLEGPRAAARIKLLAANANS